MIRCVEGVSDRERVAVTSDALDIVARLKEIDERFFVMLNRSTQRFEVHVAGQAMGTLGCELPFDRLDARTLMYVRERDAQRIEAVVAEIEAREAARERNAAGKHREAAERMADGLKYLAGKRTTDEFPDEASEGWKK